MIGRRGFLTGLVAAPAVIRFAPLMKLSVPPEPRLLTLSDITREDVRLWRNDNLFLQQMLEGDKIDFAAEGMRIGTVLRIRLPVEYRVV